MERRPITRGMTPGMYDRFMVVLLPAFQHTQNMMETGLTAQDHLDGVRLSHEDFLILYELAHFGGPDIHGTR